MQEKMRDDELGPSTQKRPRDTGYGADDDDSDARLHPNLKKSRCYKIVSDEEEEPSMPEDDKTKDPDYNPFFKNFDDLFRDPKRRQEEAAKNPEMTKEENIGSNAKEKPPEPIRQPFEDTHRDDGYVEDGWYEPKGSDSVYGTTTQKRRYNTSSSNRRRSERRRWRTKSST